MKKNTAINAFLLSFLILSTLLSSISFVSAEKVGDKVINNLGDFGSIFKGTTTLSDNAKTTISKILFIILIVLIVYSISTFLPFFPEDKPSIQWIFSIIIGILSFIFVKDGDIKYLTTTYEGLGIALTSIIPLIILVVFTMQLREKRPEIAVIVNKLIIVLFVIYSLSQWWNFDTDANKSDLVWLYPLSIIAALIWLFFEKVATRKAREAQTESTIEKAATTVKEAAANIKQQSYMQKDLAKTQSKNAKTISKY